MRFNGNSEGKVSTCTLGKCDFELKIENFFLGWEGVGGTKAYRYRIKEERHIRIKAILMKYALLLISYLKISRKKL